MLIIALLFELLLLYKCQLVYQGTRKLNLGSNNIVWSDSRYIQLYGERYSFIVDLQSNFDRFRNIVNKSEANITIKDSFRARGRTYQKNLESQCIFQNGQSLSVHPKFITDLNFTYFAIEGDNLSLGLLNKECQFSMIDFSKPEPSTLKQVYRIDDYYLGIRTQQILYIINKKDLQIIQQLDLKVCSTMTLNSQFKFTSNTYLSPQSLRLIITSKDGICIFQKISQNADFNFLKQQKAYLDQYPSFAKINDSVSFIITRNCTQIKLNLQNAKTMIENTYGSPLGGKIVGYADYNYYWSRSNYYRAHIYLQTGEDLFLQEYIYSDRFLANVSAPIKSACGGNYAYDILTSIFLDSAGIKVQYPSKTIQSAKDYNFDKLGCYNITPIIAAGITGNELTVAYIQGSYDTLLDTYKTTLTLSYRVNSVLVGDYRQKGNYSYFFIVLTNTETSMLTCYSFLFNNSKITLVGKREINSTQFVTTNGKSVFWHEVEGMNHLIKELTNTLQIVKYDIGPDFKSFQPIHFCDRCFRVIRNSGRADIYLSSPRQINRAASYFLSETQEQQFTLYNYETKKIYVEYSNKTSTTTADPSTMFYGRTISERPINLCQQSILPPIFASPQPLYTIYISVRENENKQQLVFLRTYYEPYYGYYYDNSSYISLTYNATISFKIASYRYFEQSNTLVTELIPSYDASRRVLTGIKLDFLQLANDFMLWDWMIEMKPLSKIISYQLDAYSLIVMESGGIMTKYQPNGVGIQKRPQGAQTTKLPYLISKSGNVVGYYGYYAGFTDKTIFADSVSGETLYLMNSLNFMAISPSGLLLAQKNEANYLQLNIYKKVNLLGRIKLSKALNKNSKVWFMAENIVLQIQSSGSRIECYLFNFKEDPFTYSSYSFSSTQGNIKSLVSFNEVNVAISLTSKIVILDRTLHTVQTLTTSFIQNGQPESISMAEGGNVYAKVNNILYIWRNGPCPDGKINKEGVCGNGDDGGDGVSTGELAGIIGGSVGGAALLAGSVLFIRKWKKKGRSLLESQGNNPLLQ